jgi:methyltransferase-like protein
MSSYDDVPYSVGAFPQTHPDRLATLATLFGMHPAPPDKCRVLELGCAAAGNLIPMAWAMPASRFVGVDLSQRQIEDGKRAVAELSLPNLDLRAMSILDVGPAELGEFDYILAHGVYSWVPPAVQDRILQICGEQLAPHGVAYISYNAYPGWHARGAIREMLWYHTGRFADPAERVREARGLLAFLADAVPADDAGFGSLVRQELALLRMTPDTYLLHEHLEEFNEPLYFHQFIDRAAAKGLQYLGEAQITAMVAGRFGAQTERTLRAISPDLLHMEQYMDFLRNRMFRQTLLCRAHLDVEHHLRSEAVEGFRVASSAQADQATTEVASDQPMTFRGAAGQGASLTTRDPLMKAAMAHLSARWPLPITFGDVLSGARATLGLDGPVIADVSRGLATRLLNCYASGLVEFSLSTPPFVVEASQHPVASPYARLRAQTGDRVTNVRLEGVALTEPSRLVLQNLDGRHDRAALARLVADWVKKAGPDAAVAAAAALAAPEADSPRAPAAVYVDELLKAFARGALLVA